MGKGDIVSGVVFACLFVFFLILAVAVPISLIANTEGNLCTPAETLLKDEQMMCFPEDRSETWTAEYDYRGKNYIKVYKASKKNTPTKIRFHEWKSFSRTIGKSSKYYSAIYFTMSSVESIEGTVHMNCTGSYYDKVKVFLANKKDYFSKYVDSKGNFVEYGDPIYVLNGSGYDEFSFSKSEGPQVYYLTFSNKNSNTVKLNFDILLNYTVFDLTGITPEKCDDYKCDFKAMTDDDVIVMEYKDSSSITDVSISSSSPSTLNATIHDNDINWSSVLGTGLAFALIALICLIIAIAMLFKILKKLGKLGKKAAKKAKKAEEKREAENAAQMSTMSAQPVAAQPYDPNMQAGYAQPYPGQPVAAQPYPGQM